MQFISSKARVKAFIEGDSIILGPSTVGTKSLIGKNVIIGYLARRKVQAFTFSRDFSINEFDAISGGAKVGNSCILRSGTVIYEDVTLGNGVETGHNVLIREGSAVGDRTRIGSLTQLDGTVRIGKGASIQSNAYLPHLTVIEDDAFIAPNVVFTNDAYPPSGRRVGVVVERKAAIGANACIIAPARIGEGSVVAAGSLVTKDVPPNMVVLGSPAKPYISKAEYNRKRANWEKGGK